MPTRDDQAGLEALRAPSRRLPLLDSIRIASPCTARWEDMTGDERIRFCGSCGKHVYNLSAMAADEAEELLAEHGGSMCVRLYRRADGTVLTNDCPVGARKKRIRRTLVSAAAGAGALAAAATAVFAAQGRNAPAEPHAFATGATVPPPAPPPPPPTAEQVPGRLEVGGVEAKPPPPAVRGRHKMGMLVMTR